MKPIHFICLVLAGVVLASCQTVPTQTSLSTPPKTNVPATSPTVKAAEDPEIQAVETEFSKLDVETDFPTFTETDLQK